MYLQSKPDIELLAPIARLLDISLDTLLSFHEKLSDTEIEEIIRKMDRMFSEEGYEKTYEWALRLIKEYPNCNMLIWQAAVMLDARRITDKCTNPEKYDKQINAWYELALHDENEEIQHHAADSLFGFYLRKKNYTKAEKYLDYFSEHDPMKSYYQGRLLQEQGKIKEAYEKYENVIFSGFSTLNFVLSTMAGLALRENDIGYEVYESIYKQAKSSIYVVDNYIGLRTLVHLKNSPTGVNITLFSDNVGNNKLHNIEFTDFCKEYPSVKISMKKTGGIFHDRFIMLDYGTADERVFLCGASSKDAGARITSIVEDYGVSKYTPVIATLLKNPTLILPQ